DFLTVSCTGQSALPHLGQEKRPPVLKSISISSRFLSASNLASATIHGGTRPSASWNRSISRIGLTSPRSPPSCRRPLGRQEQALAGARSSRVLDRHSTRRRIQRAAGAKGWLRRTKQKDRPRGQKPLFTVPGHPFMSARRLVNAAPYSFFNIMGIEPPVVALTALPNAEGCMKDTGRNIMSAGEFVVNLVCEAIAAAMNI